MCAPTLTRLIRLHRQAQTESSKDGGEGLEPWVTSLGKRPIQGFAGEPGFLSELGHSAHCIGNRAQGNRYGARVAVSQHRFNILSDLSLAF
jgi:hypothetical protein